jgi:tetratricopeptide (TPR) repeat protein
MSRLKKILTAATVVLALGAAAGATAFYLRGSEERLFSALEAGKRPSGALSTLRKILLDNPDDLPAQKWALRLEIETGDLNAAQNRLNLLQVKAPDYYGTVSGACYFYLVKHRGAKGIKSCERAAALSGRSVDDLNRLGSAYLQAENYLKALPALLEAQRKNPENLKVQNNLGYYFLKAGVYEEAIRVLRALLQKDPDFPEAQKNLARAFYENGQYQEAAAEIKTILVREPANKDMLMILALIYAMHFHDKAEGTKYARAAIAAGMDADRARALMNMMNNPKPRPDQCPLPDQPAPPSQP